METSPAPARRPLPITLICVIGGFGALVAISRIVRHWNAMTAESTGGAVAAIAGLALTLASLYGMWRMRRWGVALLGLALLVRIAYGWLGGPPIGLTRLLGPGLILTIGAVYLPRMN